MHDSLCMSRNIVRSCPNDQSKCIKDDVIKQSIIRAFKCNEWLQQAAQFRNSNNNNISNNLIIYIALFSKIELN